LDNYVKQTEAAELRVAYKNNVEQNEEISSKARLFYHLIICS